MPFLATGMDAEQRRRGAKSEQPGQQAHAPARTAVSEGCSICRPLRMALLGSVRFNMRERLAHGDEARFGPEPGHIDREARQGGRAEDALGIGYNWNVALLFQVVVLGSCRPIGIDQPDLAYTRAFVAAQLVAPVVGRRAGR